MFILRRTFIYRFSGIRRRIYLSDTIILYPTGERLTGAQVRIGNNINLSNPACPMKVTDAMISQGQRITIPCNNIVGRYISVHLTNREALTLCEVEAYYGMCDGIPESSLGIPSA